jgi:hypothetical protein
MTEAEVHFRQAGRLLELLPDEEQQRNAKLAFRLASRVRSDRLDLLLAQRPWVFDD